MSFFWALALWLSQSSAESVNFSRLHQEVLTAHTEARTYQDWSLSPFSPEHLAHRLQNQSASEGFANQFCSFLFGLPTEDVYHYHEALLSLNDLPCREEILGQYQEFLATKTELAAMQIKLSRLAEPQSPAPLLKRLGPSREVVFDNVLEPVIIDGKLPTKTVALTFDDGPHSSLTPQLLDLLANESLKVNFFLVGRNTLLNQGIVQRMASAGHEVGCHSFTHPDLRKLSQSQAVDEIERGFQAITTALGFPTTTFRFPYGAKTPALQSYLTQTRTPEFFWNIDTLDWKHKDPGLLLKFAVGEIDREGKGVILMHDIQPQTLAMLPALLDYLRESGYQIAVLRPKYARISR